MKILESIETEQEAKEVAKYTFIFTLSTIGLLIIGLLIVILLVLN